MGGWIGECRDGIIEGIEAIGYSVMYVAINVGISKESVDNLSAAAHKLINANTQQNKLENSTNNGLQSESLYYKSMLFIHISVFCCWSH